MNLKKLKSGTAIFCIAVRQGQNDITSQIKVIKQQVDIKIIAAYIQTVLISEKGKACFKADCCFRFV